MKKKEDASKEIAFIQNGREVTYREVTTEDLLIDAERYNNSYAKIELRRRGIKL